MLPKRKVVLAFMAHPDDAEILCGGTLARLADAGWAIHIATTTAGDCGTMVETPWAIAARRTAEGAAAAKVIGGEYHCLGERDGMVTYDKETLQKAMDLFRRVTPTLLFTHAEKDYHMDHEMTSLIARGASFMYGCPNVSCVPRGEGTRVPCMYYCDPVELLDPYGREVEPSTVVDVTEQMDRKAEMLACHASQRDWLREHHGMDEYIESMKRVAARRGEKIGTAAAEGFVQHKAHPYPTEDWLREMFG